MRIAYMLTSLGVGGAERQVLALAGRMAARGHTVVIVVLRAPLAEELPTALNVARLNMRRSTLSFLAGLSRGRRILVEFAPDLIHSHSFHSNLVARLLKPSLGGPAVLSTIHNVYEGGWHRMAVYRLTDPLARRSTAVSQAARDRFVRLKAVPARKCSVVSNGIDTAEFSPDPERRALTREAMGAGDNFIWIAAGRIVPAKDFPNLLRAFSLVRAAIPATQLWIAGEATEAGSKRTVIGFDVEISARDQVRRLGLRRDMPALLDAADAFVLASAWEGMPLVVGEAMAMEKPIVATDVGGVRELVGEAGRMVPARSPEALAQAMIELMQDAPEARLALGRQARRRIAASFSMDAKADEWEALYREVLGMRR